MAQGVHDHYMISVAPHRFVAIYDHPIDYPNHFVVREWEVRLSPSPDNQNFLAPVMIPNDHVHLFEDLDLARELASEGGRTRFTRDRNDDPALLETWI